MKERLGRQNAEALDVGERALRWRGKVADPLEKLQISGLPNATSEMMALLAIVVSRPVDVLGFGQIPVDAQAQPGPDRKMPQQRIFYEIVRITQVPLLHRHSETIAVFDQVDP